VIGADGARRGIFSASAWTAAANPCSRRKRRIDATATRERFERLITFSSNALTERVHARALRQIAREAELTVGQRVLLARRECLFEPAPLRVLARRSAAASPQSPACCEISVSEPAAQQTAARFARLFLPAMPGRRGLLLDRSQCSPGRLLCSGHRATALVPNGHDSGRPRDRRRSCRDRDARRRWTVIGGQERRCDAVTETDPYIRRDAPVPRQNPGHPRRTSSLE